MSKKKIAVVAPGGVDLKDEMIREIVSKVFVKNVEKLKENDTSLDFYMMKKGFVDFGAFSWESLNLWNSFELFEVILGLKGKGYDAVLIHCFGDPYLYPLRQLMDIPVVGVFENALYFAKMMGKKVGLITFSDYIVSVMEDALCRYGCKDWVVSIKTARGSSKSGLTGEDFMEALVDSRRMIERVSEAGRECIKEGAEVLIPGCTIMSPVICMAPGCEKEYPHGLQVVDGVPIVDVISAAVRMTEVFATLKQAGIPWISRASTFNTPPDDIIKNTIAHFPYHGAGEQRY